MKTIILISVLIMLAACATPKPVSSIKNVREAIVGSWTWEKNKCDDYSQYYSFSEDGKSLFVFAKDGFVFNEQGDIKQTMRYSILGESQNVIRAQIDDEFRKTEVGSPIVWDLILVSDRKFCWRRTDWAENACTAYMKKCDSRN